MRDKAVAEFHNRADEVRTTLESSNKAGLEERARYFLSKAAEAEQEAAKLENPDIPTGRRG
jgi:hypothetical protein